ncbi:alpha/beta fold hydrolase [Actinopolymorpha singaporensis]|uniref:Alpha/beta hydrolase family protein n=1 Tax=Actinopolymorpha singaporensis TaxID=117157 RepID=A0A1H1YCL9_9ACTN|nr:alpha/beta hydrolase [Actinopolymorpha singaporensis]SDT19193.1 Alpha/beta hydrolase family protein [Actinopolymorpha singaporensis]
MAVIAPERPELPERPSRRERWKRRRRGKADQPGKAGKARRPRRRGRPGTGRPGRPKRTPIRRRVLRRLGRLVGHRPVWRKPKPPLRLLPQATKVSAVGLVVVLAPGGTVLGRVVRLLVVVAAALLVLRAQRGGAPRRRARLATAVGLVDVAAGFGIGLPHAGADGLSLRSMAGVILAVVGLPLLLAGILAYARTVRRWLRLPVLVASAVAGAVLLPPIVSGVAAVNPPPVLLDKLDPGDKGFVYDDVELHTSDGVLLRGWYIPSRNSAAVVLAPDAGMTRSNVLPQAALLAEHGYGVLLYDPRGTGRSEGDAMDLGWTGERDIYAGVKFLAHHYGVRRSKIGVIGLGRGGEAAMAASAHDGRIRAVVAEGVGRRSPGDTLRIPGTPTGWLQRVTENVEYATAAVLRGSLPPRSLRHDIRAMRPHKLLLVAERGQIRAGQLYRRTAPGTVTLWKLPDIPSLQAYATRIAAWEDQVIGFLQKNLRPRQVPMSS